MTHFSMDTFVRSLPDKFKPSARSNGCPLVTLMALARSIATVAFTPW